MSMDGLTSKLENMDLIDDPENDEEKELECHARMISFFAHKGGVSKTTNVHHLAYILAQKFNFKVLMIDADPQQNLTQTCCVDARDDPNWRDNEERGTIFTALERLHYGMKDGDYIDPANCIQINESEITGGGQLWLLPGSLDLAKLEPQITFAHNICNPAVFPLFDDIAGGFRHLFISTCAHYDIDFCLIDMGPSIGELNKSLFWASDYFVIPCSADSYCNTTMKTMEYTLPTWNLQQERLSVVTSEMTMPLNPEPPKFLGLIFSLFQTVGKNKVPIKNSQHWMDVIKDTVQRQLTESLGDMVHEGCNEEYTLAEIPHFLSLQPIAQKSHCPVYDIGAHDGYFVINDDGEKVPMSKTEVQRHSDRAKYFQKKYIDLAQTIIHMINAEDADPDMVNAD
eukprot:226561_1